MISRLQKGFLILGALFFLWIGLQIRKSMRPTVEMLPPTALPPEIKERITLDRRGTFTVLARSGKNGQVSRTTRYLPPEGREMTDIDQMGNVHVVVKDKGLCASPAVGVLVGTDAKLKPALLLKVAFAGRFGVDVGATFQKAPAVSLFVGIEWTPPWRFGNTALVVGRDFRREYHAGLKIRF